MKIVAVVLTSFLAGVLTTLAFAHPAVQDPEKVSPQLYKVLLENDQVKVLEWRLPAGQKEPMHKHHPGVVYEFGNGRFKVTTPDGKTEVSDGEAGSVFYRDTTTHAIENIGTTEGHALDVELKKVCK
jgi:mannose-6-phosphate isomerase-like protein (cupin superfamily)